MSYNHKEIEKNGKNTGQKRIPSTPMMILKTKILCTGYVSLSIRTRAPCRAS